MSSSLTTIILTYNSAGSLRQVVDSCRDVSSRILVVDSYSEDGTYSLAEDLGCEVTQHPFDNYAKQRNWAQHFAGLRPDEWVLHLDSDEVLDDRLGACIREVLEEDNPDVDGYLVRRLHHFMGRPIRHGHLNPNWHLRLFRAGRGRCEDRRYDQHFLVPGLTRRLDGVMHDLQLQTIEEWTQAHNRWSTAEAEEIANRFEEIAGPPSGRTLEESLVGDPREQKRWLKNRLYYRVPPLLRPFLFFVYSYVIKLGFLDGRTGLIYHVLQAFWFRFLVDAKIVERRSLDGAGRVRPADDVSTEEASGRVSSDQKTVTT